MFGRKPPSGPGETPPQPAAAPTALQQPSIPRAVTPPIPARPEGEAEAALRAVPAQPARRPVEPVRVEPAAPAKELRKLVVGRDITLSGELACDHLIVEGIVEASVKECQRLEIAETGLFRGTVEIREADIGGRFEGELTVQGRLAVRTTGRIDGKILYGELAVEAGGTIDGEIRTVGAKGGVKSTSKAGIRPPSTDSLPLSGGSETQAETRAEAVVN